MNAEYPARENVGKRDRTSEIGILGQSDNTPPFLVSTLVCTACSECKNNYNCNC